MQISITILTKNNEKTIREVLEPLSVFDEVLILDTGSTDSTLERAKPFPNVKIHHSPFTHFGELKNKAADLATHDWIFSLDSDEICSQLLLKEIVALNPDKNCIYSVPRRNYFRGKWIKGCGWHPDLVKRLYNKTSTRFSNDFVHESLISKGLKMITLQGYLKHTSYDSIHDFMQKMQTYSNLFAIQHQGKKKSSPLKAVMRGFYTFFKNYILQKGFLLGKEGFIISCYNAETTYYKYLLLWERNHSGR
ncbi:MAG: glycosyltransferase family 2 protein [Waddliaceae bacterium]